MKSIYIILIASFVTLVFVASITTIVMVFNTKTVVNNRFMVIGDYSFEMLSGPDEYGDIEIRVKNIKGIPFTCDEYANEIEGVGSIISTEWVEFASIVGRSERTMKIHHTSGLLVDTQLKGIVSDEKNHKLVDYDVTAVACGYNSPDPNNLVFESASNFFGIN